MKKQHLVGGAIGPLPKYRRELVLDLIYRTAVQPPVGWLTPPERGVIALDAGHWLTEEQRLVCHPLIAKLITFCHQVIPTLIQRDISRRRAIGVLPRPITETLRRARGPRAVRDLLFELLPGWPIDVPDHLGNQVAARLDDALRNAAPRPQKPVTHLFEPCRQIVCEYAAGRHLVPRDEQWLTSEVVDQLVRNAENGRLPDDLRAWTLGTARAKWRYRGSTGHSLTQAGRSQHTHAVVDLADVADVVALSVDVRQALSQAADGFELTAREWEAIGASDPFNVAAYRAVARMLRSDDLDDVTQVVRQTPEGEAILAEELASFTDGLNRDRRTALVRIITESLRQALSDAYDRMAPAPV